MSLQRSYDIKEEYKKFRAAQGLSPLDDKDLLLMTVLSALTELRESLPADAVGVVYDELGNLASFLDQQHFEINPESYTSIEDFIQLSDSDDE